MKKMARKIRLLRLASETIKASDSAIGIWIPADTATTRRLLKREFRRIGSLNARSEFENPTQLCGAPYPFQLKKAEEADCETGRTTTNVKTSRAGGKNRARIGHGPAPNVRPSLDQNEETPLASSGRCGETLGAELALAFMSLLRAKVPCTKYLLR